MPEISVIIATYNRANTLSMAIRSVLNQTLKDFEIIIVDDSTNAAAEEAICKLSEDIF